MANSNKSFVQHLKTTNIYHSPNSLFWLFKYMLFKNEELQNKHVLDIGGGIGLLSFFMASEKAESVILLEPEADGSQKVNMEKFTLLQNEFKPYSRSIFRISRTIQEFTTEEKFDYLVLYASINHLDESACINLQNSENAREAYRNIFIKLKSLSKNGAKLVIVDCMRSNLFYHLGLTSPLAKTIEWHKHQNPRVWNEIISSTGWQIEKSTYLSFKQLRLFGKIFFGNKFFAYILGTPFYLKFKLILEEEVLQ
jgi:16S rRNA G966 N2-methylase RsmD